MKSSCNAKVNVPRKAVKKAGTLKASRDAQRVRMGNNLFVTIFTTAFRIKIIFFAHSNIVSLLF